MTADELESLLKAATPGEWGVEEDPTQDGDHATMVVLPGKNGQFGTWLAGCIHNWQEASFGERRISWKEAESNAALIVALHNAAPTLIEALRERDRLREFMQEIATQKLAAEMDYHTLTGADWQGGYETLVTNTRAALALLALEGQP